jgi:hypothetical protein
MQGNATFIIRKTKLLSTGEASINSEQVNHKDIKLKYILIATN